MANKGSCQCILRWFFLHAWNRLKNCGCFNKAIKIQSLHFNNLFQLITFILRHYVCSCKISIFILKFFKRNEMAHLPTQTSLPLIYTTMYSFQFEIAVNKHYCRKFEWFFFRSRRNDTKMTKIKIVISNNGYTKKVLKNTQFL